MVETSLAVVRESKYNEFRSVFINPVALFKFIHKCEESTKTSTNNVVAAKEISKLAENLLNLYMNPSRLVQTCDVSDDCPFINKTYMGGS